MIARRVRVEVPSAFPRLASDEDVGRVPGFVTGFVNVTVFAGTGTFRFT